MYSNVLRSRASRFFDISILITSAAWTLDSHADIFARLIDTRRFVDRNRQSSHYSANVISQSFNSSSVIKHISDYLLQVIIWGRDLAVREKEKERKRFVSRRSDTVQPIVASADCDTRMQIPRVDITKAPTIRRL